MTLTTAAVREAFLEFFRGKGHTVVASSSLVPHNDPTLLFTNAGMNQFKETFLGLEKRSYSRATTAQRCVRAGGKHNDLENVGYTARHHTFFEMLGNFSFGDYFKEDAIAFAWEFLTDVIKLPQEKLLVTVYEDDNEAYDIWAKQIGVPDDRIVRIGDKKGKRYESDNFWAMGDTGPCGPCTEIFYDHGEHIQGGPPGSPEEDGDRFIEIWNVVFMQFNRHADGRMEPLPKPSVDTGMGLERISAILQGVHSNYEIDIFQFLIKETAKLLHVDDLQDKSLRVIADHIRSCSFLIVDGVMPSNEGRGYVLRRIIRRAVRHGNKLGATEPFFFQLVSKLGDVMGEAYDELNSQQSLIVKVLKTEEEQFLRTLERGLNLLEDALQSLNGTEVPGELVFKLYDTYGFPDDLTADIARERNLTIDHQGFDVAMAEQRARAKEASQFNQDYNQLIRIDETTDFVGYEQFSQVSTVTALFSEGQQVEQLAAGTSGQVVLEQTPFYGESGGQVGDHGTIELSNGGRFIVTNTQKSGKAVVHIGTLTEGVLAVGDEVTALVDESLRRTTALNHSATHLLHAALRQVLGEHVTQKGSLVNAQRLRFDFSHFEPVTDTQLRQIEQIVNTQIRANHPVTTRLMDLEAAKQAGAMALFGEKYDSEVRVVSMGDFSTELCGGTHVQRTGDIGLLKVISEGGIAAGIRRIEAATGAAALAIVEEQQQQLSSIAELLKSDMSGAVDKVRLLNEKNRHLERELEHLTAKLASQAGNSLADQAETIAGVAVVVSQLQGVAPKALRDMVDQLKQKMGSGIVLLAVAEQNKVSLIAGVTKDLTGKVKAGELVNMVASQIGGKGGGRPDMAQAGGSQPEALPAALATVAPWLQERLA